MTSNDWEQGSDFHFLDISCDDPLAPWNEVKQFHKSGRSCLNSLLRLIKGKSEKLRIWIPSYYCDKVIYPLLNEDYNCIYYDGDPINGWDVNIDEIEHGDVFISNCYFGVIMINEELTTAIRDCGVILVEDHSQGPYSIYSWNSKADYCFASLRKTLPIPDGGVLWSPLKKALPDNDLFVTTVSSKRLGAMLAKKLYLEDNFSDKSLFRLWYTEAEEEIDLCDVAGMSDFSKKMIESFDISTWYDRKTQNYIYISTLIDQNNIKLLHLNADIITPMGLIILTPNKPYRTKMLAHLVKNNIYPAVLWPLLTTIPVERSEKANKFADRVLFIHIDGRYNTDDMSKVAHVINSFHV